jgi:RNA polymerase sigma-70 factor (ECF subfamily)
MRASIPAERSLNEFDTAITFVVEDGRITRMYAMRDPHELGRLDRMAELRR